MTDGPLISVVMPAYNAEAYIREAILSVEAQTYDNWELIVVDDCSSDRTADILREIKNEKIRCFRNESNRRTAFSRNFAISQAKGEWIAFLDADDAWDCTKLQKQVDLLEKKPDAQLIFTGSAFMDEHSNRKEFVFGAPEVITRDEILKQNKISNSSVMIRKELMVRHPFPNEKMIHEDFAVWLAVLKEVPYAYGINEPLLIYRRSSDSKSGNKLKAAVMNWNTYRYSGESFGKSIISMLFYAVLSLKKYSKM